MSNPIEMLPGIAEYARVALPLDYPPSRDYRSRWTTDRPILPLHKWFSSHIADYAQFIEAMRREVAYVADIPLDIDHDKLPMPGWIGPPYTPFDSLTLHTMIATKRPQRYFEIGSGATTCFAHHAIKAHGLATEILSIDPDPRAAIDAICDRVIRDGLETCDITLFDQLEANDILFFDGSHRAFMNSDVTVFFIDILPRLKPGVIVHLHDIVLPWDYSEMFHNWYWNEQYMLAVYLMGNMGRIDPLMPTAFVTSEPLLEPARRAPFIEIGKLSNHWKYGGAMWFTHTAPPLYGA